MAQFISIRASRRASMHFDIRSVLFAATVAFVAAAAGSARAAPVVSDLFALRQQNSANSNNFATGDILFWGALSVDPGSSYGTARQCPTGAVCDTPGDLDYVRTSLFQRDFTATGPHLYASRGYDPTLTNPWTLRFSSDPALPPPPNPDTIQLDTPAVGNVDLMPFVKSFTVAGAGLTPTLSWQLPDTGPGVDSVRVVVLDHENRVTVNSANPAFPRTFQQSDIVFVSDAIDPATTSYMLTTTDVQLQYGHSYGLGLFVEHCRNNVCDGSISSIDSRSSQYFDFTPIDSAGDPVLNGAPVYLPTATPIQTTSGTLDPLVYSFDIDGVSGDSTTFIDPFVASGYIYTIGAGDPNFKSVQIATDVGDGLYDIEIWDGTQYILVATGLLVGDVFDFTTDILDSNMMALFAGGVTQFKVTGIETDAGVNPFDVTAFITGLMFVTDGSFTGTMQAIVTEVPDALPEPGTLAVFVVGLAGLAFARRKRASHL